MSQSKAMILGCSGLTLTPDEIAVRLKKESDTNRRIIQAANITAD